MPVFCPVFCDETPLAQSPITSPVKLHPVSTLSGARNCLQTVLKHPAETIHHHRVAKEQVGSRPSAERL